MFNIEYTILEQVQNRESLSKVSGGPDRCIKHPGTRILLRPKKQNFTSEVLPLSVRDIVHTLGRVIPRVTQCTGTPTRTSGEVRCNYKGHQKTL